MSSNIYVACLASYNNGVLHGAWIHDVDIFDKEELQARIAEMLAKSPSEGAEEWAIHDYEGFGDYRVSEWHDLGELCAVAALINEFGEEVASVGLDNVTDVGRASEWIQDHYQGVYRNLEDWAEQYLEDTGMLAGVPESLRYHINFGSWARDAEMGGDISSHDTAAGVLVFSTH